MFAVRRFWTVYFSLAASPSRPLGAILLEIPEPSWHRLERRHRAEARYRLRTFDYTKLQEDYTLLSLHHGNDPGMTECWQCNTCGRYHPMFHRNCVCHKRVKWTRSDYSSAPWRKQDVDWYQHNQYQHNLKQRPPRRPRTQAAPEAPEVDPDSVMQFLLKSGISSAVLGEVSGHFHKAAQATPVQAPRDGVREAQSLKNKIKTLMSRSLLWKKRPIKHG